MSGAIATRLDNIKERGGIRSREVALLLNTTPVTVSRWRQGKAEPQPERRDNLLRLEWLVSQLSEFYPPEEAKLWLFSPHPMLDGETPADRIRAGGVEDVLAIIAQLQDGAFV
jgi:uncharacterized protein (DUF2384 family)